jgi:O-antigen/teichoic acid export membrane protein
MTSIGKKIISGAAWTAAEMWGRQAANFTIFVLLARHLGPEAFGFVSLAMVAPAIFSMPVTTGIPDALVQRAEIGPIHLDSAFWLLAATGTVFSALIWTFAGMIAAAFQQPLLEDLVRWTSLIVAIQALAAIPSAVLKRQLNFRLFALRTLVGTVIGGAVGIGMAIAEFGVWSLVGMQIAKTTAETTVLLLGSTWRPRLRYSYLHCHELFGFALPLIGQSLWNLVNEEMPKVVLGAFLGPYAVGVYALARRPLELLTQVFLSPLMAVAMPAVSRVQNEPAKIDRFFNATVRVAALVGFPAFVGFAAIAPVAVPFIFGAHWSSAVFSSQILMLLGLQRTIDGLCGFTILALGHSGLILKLNIAYTVLGVILLPAAAQISLEATMVALVLCNFTLLPIFLFFAHRIAGIDVLKPLAIFPRLATAATLMFASATTSQLSASAHAEPVVIMACAILIGAAVYGVAAIVLVRPDLLSARDMILRLRD